MSEIESAKVNKMRMPLRILIVEDDPDTAQSLAMLLHDVGQGLLTATTANCLSDAVAKAKANCYSAAFVDLSLPDASGVQTVKMFRQAHPTVPVIVYTGTADPNMIAECIEAGAEDCILKSIDPVQLIDRVRIAVLRHEVDRDFDRLRDLSNAMKETCGELREQQEKMSGIIKPAGVKS